MSKQETNAQSLPARVENAYYDFRQSYAFIAIALFIVAPLAWCLTSALAYAITPVLGLAWAVGSPVTVLYIIDHND